ALSQGIDRIYVADGMSTDGTRDILTDLYAQFPGVFTIIDDAEPHFRQAHVMNQQIAQAGADGAEWIIATDVDEFVYATNGSTVAEALTQCPHDKLYMRVWPQFDWDIRFVEPHAYPKVAFRWSPGVQVVIGNHEVSLPGGV